MNKYEAQYMLISIFLVFVFGFYFLIGILIKNIIQIIIGILFLIFHYGWFWKAIWKHFDNKEKLWILQGQPKGMFSYDSVVGEKAKDQWGRNSK